jgi:hypothetical protein
MLLKLSPGVNFINVLHKAFMSTGLESVKIQSSGHLFTLLSSAGVKAARRSLVKLSPEEEMEHFVGRQIVVIVVKTESVRTSFK